MPLDNKKNKQHDAQPTLQYPASAISLDLSSIQKLTNFGEHGVEIVNNNTYQITDVELTDMFGLVKQTISRTILYPSKTTRGHVHKLKDETYHFVKGSGLLLLQSQDYNALFKIEPETWKFIEKATFHMVINLSANEDLEFETFYPGKSERPRFEKK